MRFFQHPNSESSEWEFAENLLTDDSCSSNPMPTTAPGCEPVQRALLTCDVPAKLLLLLLLLRLLYAASLT